MGFGSYDEEEHEHRENQKDVEVETEHTRATHNGDVTMEGADDVEDMLNAFESTVKEANTDD